jgi:hypothetical protein
MVPEQLQGLQPIGGLADLQALGGEKLGDQAAKLTFVFGEDDLGHGESLSWEKLVLFSLSTPVLIKSCSWSSGFPGWRWLKRAEDDL